MSILWFEFLLSLRRLFRRKTQNGLLLVTFAVSIGLSLLSWSLFHTIFLSRPDFDPHARLGVVTYAGSMAMGGVGRQHSNRLEIEVWQKEQTVFSDFAPFISYRSSMLIIPEGRERVLSASLSSDALRLVGAQPLLGRLFTADEDKDGCAPVALLSHRLWQTRFAADPQVIGRVVNLDGEGATIIGVMPADFRFPNDQDLWLPMGWDAPDWPNYPIRDALAQLKPGVSRARAEQDLQQILTRHASESRSYQAGARPVLMPFRDFYLESKLRVSALILFALALIFVVVSCVNAANLTLIDFFGRLPETAAGFALGIPRRAAIRSVCFQVGLVAAAAVALSLVMLLVFAPRLHAALALMNAPYWLKFSFGWHHLWMALGLAAASAAITLIVPIAYLCWVNPDRVVREHAYASRGTGRGWWRRALLAGQIALLTVLGICAALLVRSSYAISATKWGYDPRAVFIGKIDVNEDDYPNAEQRRVLYRRVVEEAQRIPGVRGAAIMAKPLGYSAPPNAAYALDAAALAEDKPLGRAIYSEMSEGMFATLGLTFVAGEPFPARVSDQGPVPVVINQSLANRLWPGQDPLQRELHARYSWMNAKDETDRLVVCGVVRDFQAAGPLAPVNDLIYEPFRNWMPSNLFLFARGEGAMPSAAAMRDAVHRVDSRIALYFPDSLAHQIDMTLGSVRMTTWLTSAFAAAAVLLCAVGVYSLTVSQILQSGREFGVKMALGAEPGRLWRQFTRGHLLAAAAGIAVGIVGATQAVGVLRALLFGVGGRPALTFALVAIAILAVAALACVPALYRLRRINPAECLRSL